jgi:predicted DNA-binding transcriptional regulator AlpA
MSNDFKGKRLLKVKATAKLLSIAPQSIYNGIGKKSKNKLPIEPIRIGKSIRFDLEDINEYIESLKKEATDKNEGSGCQSAFKFDPPSASKIDPPLSMNL